MLVKTYRLRLYVLYLIPLFVFVGLVIRLYCLQVLDKPYYEGYAARQHFKTYDIIPMRGKIFDANGHELAGSVILDKAHLNLHQLPEEHGSILPELASQFSQVIDDPRMTHDEILRRLQGKVNRHPFIGRDLTDAKKVALLSILAKPEFKEAGIPSSFIEFSPENNRRYTRGGLAPHVVGYTQPDTTGDNKGITGVERTYNDEMRGKEKEYVARKSATGNPMEPADPELVESTFGHSVKLTIDESIQAVTQDVLQQGVDKSMADAGVAVCYSVKTGEILSLASYPTFNLNDVAGASPERRRNRALTDAIEPGSVMKIITFASLFDDNKAEPFDYINCEGGYWVMPGTGRVIKDSHDLDTVSVAEVFQHSSNIGTIKAARAFTEAEFYAHLKRFGFGARTGVDLPGESRGVLSNYKDWSAMSMSSLPMGYEIQLTAMQVVGAVGAIANKGKYMQPHVVKEILDHNGNTVKKIEPEFVRSVASPDACRKVVDLMELVVEKGTAKAAQLEGYRVGGKTGTTKKLDPVTRRYESAYIASFCGVAPIEDPEVCIYVYVDNPRGDKVYGGQIAAPVFREIAREAMRVLRVPERKNTMPAEDFRKTLQKVRNQIEGRVPMEMLTDFGAASSGDVSQDTVPDLLHLSLREAVEKAALAGVEVRVSGSGIVVAQDPPPNETIEGERVVHITLTDADKFISKLVDDYEDLMGLENAPALADAQLGGARPLTSLSLSLTSDSGRIAVPVDVQGNGSDASPGGRGQVDIKKTALPNLDASAGREHFKDFEKSLKEMEKRRDENARAPVVLQVDELPVNRKKSEVPVPVFDGSDDLDPTVAPIVPIEITTPEKEQKSKNPEGDSLYNLL